MHAQAGDSLELVSYDGTNWREINRSTAAAAGLGPVDLTVGGGAAVTDGEAGLLGVSDLHASAQTISSGSNPTITNMGRLHAMLNVTAIGTAGTVRVSGTSYDPDTGTTTGSDTEDITVSAGETGYYRSSKLWVGTVTLSGLTTTSVTANLFRYEGFELTGHYTLDTIQWFWHASAANNDLQIVAYTYDFVARTRTTVVDHTETNIASNTPFSYKRSSLAADIDFADGERVVAKIVSSTKTAGFTYTMKFTTIG